MKASPRRAQCHDGDIVGQKSIPRTMEVGHGMAPVRRKGDDLPESVHTGVRTASSDEANRFPGNCLQSLLQHALNGTQAPAATCNVLVALDLKAMKVRAIIGDKGAQIVS
jgi:hypothetical protein